jgi:uncharacterized cupredoxin-like copper-binding protein
MWNGVSRFVFAVLVSVLALTGAKAAETEVRVALLDMTSMGMPGYGAGMMSPGGYGGQGMMGQGFGPGQGPGGGYGMAPGMMGGGWGPGAMMHGMMSIRAVQASVEAGTVTFNVTNWSSSILHELVVVAVDSPNAPLPYDYNTGLVIENQVKVEGETEEMAPQASITLELELQPGSYMLICNLPYHYAAGMALPFTVTQGAS